MTLLLLVIYQTKNEWKRAGKFNSFLPWGYLYIYILHSLFLYLPFYDNPVGSFFCSQLHLCSINIEPNWSHPHVRLALPDHWSYEAHSLILFDLLRVMRFFCLPVSPCAVPALPPCVAQLRSVRTWNGTSVSKLATGRPTLINLP